MRSSAPGAAPVGHIVFHKTYSSRRGFFEVLHEQAYLLAKGRPPTPAAPLADVRPWEFSGNCVHSTEKAVGILTPLIASFSQPHDLVLDPFSPLVGASNHVYERAPGAVLCKRWAYNAGI